ncbi:MAG: hypothetical protein NTW87_31545 [Planctomycetota bacterium]|nr:hypothetical protein [Planctomycetota bacterium]
MIRAPNGRGYQYEMLIPWALIRKDPSQRPGAMRDLRLGVAVYDDDGAGIKGALELGAGTTTSSYNPKWLCNLTLVDVSDEKIEHYRKVISLVPGSDEAARFLDLILLSKRGEKADAERAAELESFIRANPACRNTLRAVGLLRSTYQRRGEADPQARLEKFLREANMPAQLQQAVAGAAFRIWVLPDAKRPPQMIMVQFCPTGDWNRAVRAYWGSIAGTPCGPWGRDGAREMLPMGPLPKPGEWAQLSISPFDLGLESADVKEIALTTFGGVVHFDRASVIAAGKEVVLIDDAWPPKAQVRQSAMKFVDNPRHDGAKSWTFENQQACDGLQNAQIVLGDGAPLLSFAAISVPAAPAAPPASQQELFRKVAHLIPDTPEGFGFLQRALDLHTGDGPVKTGKCIEELKAFLKANPDTPSAMAIVKMLYSLFTNAGEKDPRGACDQLLQEYKLPRDVKRVFYTEYAPAWTEWFVLGAFAAQGERRGLDTVLGPERAVDMAWKAVNASGSEVGWKKISNRLGADKKPNWDPVVDLRRHLAVTRTVEQRGPYFGFAYTKFNVPTKRRALLLFGAQDMISVWLNGKRVVSELETQAQKDKEVIEVQLRSGENELLLKVGVPRDQRLGFVFRLADPDGKPFADVQNE